MKLDCGQIVGLTVLNSDSHEAVVVNIMGNLQPAMFGQTMQALHVPEADVELGLAEAGSAAET